MSKGFRFELDKKGVGELLKSDATRDVTRAAAEDFAARCGEGYEVEDKEVKTRTGFNVRAVTEEAIEDNLENNTLEKILHSYPDK